MQFVCLCLQRYTAAIAARYTAAASAVAAGQAGGVPSFEGKAGLRRIAATR